MGTYPTQQHGGGVYRGGGSVLEEGMFMGNKKGQTKITSGGLVEKETKLTGGPFFIFTHWIWSGGIHYII